MPKKIGRRKGVRSKGFFFRAGRGWFTKEQGRFVPLVDEDGQRLRDERVDPAIVKKAYGQHLVSREKVPGSAIGVDAQVGAVCAAYLDHVKTQAGDVTAKHPTGLAKTYIDRGQTLFDFCYGLPGAYFCGGDKKKRASKGDAQKKRIHPGFGTNLCSELTQADIDAWLKAHAWTPGGWRTRVQAVKRAFNFGVQRKMISVNPIRGYKLPKSVARVTYLTPDQEAAMVDAASPSFALALTICIRTGARFGCEFAALRPRHVRQEGDRMEWFFKVGESKTKKDRTIRITDKTIIAAVRERLAACSDGSHLFRSESGEPWTRRMLSQNFRRVKAKIAKKGIHLDADACMYTTRHTYAKRVLEGHWTGKPTSISTLARLMGNSVKVCVDHYLQWSGADNEMLWGSA